ncbi:MAG: right-handed parallel beta-helix repeat-containing protein [Anaerolineales bacterium]
MTAHSTLMLPAVPGTPGISGAADWLLAQQDASGGYPWTPGGSVTTNTQGPSARGALWAYQHTTDPSYLTSALATGDYLVPVYPRTYGDGDPRFAAHDPLFLEELSEVSGDTDYAAFVQTYFWDLLSAGTYGAANDMDAAEFGAYIVDARDGQGYVALSPWDLSATAIAAHLAGETAIRDDLMGAILEGLNRTGAGDTFDVLGLAGAVWAAAATGTELDPTSGAYAADDSTADLAARLAGWQQPVGSDIDGAWLWNATVDPTDSTNADLQSTAFAVLALHAQDPVLYADNIARGAGFLRALQQSSGQFLGYPGGDPNDNGGVEVHAEALTALVTVAPDVVYVDDDWATGLDWSGDPDGTGPATAFGYDAFATVSNGIDGVAPAGTVHVAAGIYSEAVTVDKALTLLGAQAGIEPVAGGRPGGESTIMSDYALTLRADNVEVNGFEVADFRYGINVQGPADATRESVVVSHNYLHSTTAWVGILVGEDNGGGVDAPGTGYFRDVLLTRNRVSVSASAGSDPYALSAVGFTSGFTDSVTFENVELSHNDLQNLDDSYGVFCGADPAKFEFLNPLITGNHIHDCSTGMNLYNLINAEVSNNLFEDCSYQGAQINVRGGSVISNTFRNIGPSPYWPYNGSYYPSYGLALWGTQYGPVGSHDVQVVSNNFYYNDFSPQLENGARVLSGSDAGTIEFHYNNFHDGGAAAGAFAVVNYATGVVDTENNWWGCNEGPSNSAECGTYTGTVDADPWLVLDLTANPLSLPPGGTSDLTASLRENSAGQDTSAGGYVPDDITTTFAAAVGSVSPVITGTLQGLALSTYTAPATPGAEIISTTVHNETVTLTLSIAAPTVKVYLPLILNNYATAPDLLVEAVQTGGELAVVIANRGTAPVQEAFWVDLYVNPDSPPTGVNQVWQSLSDHGIAWGVTQALDVDEVLTLTVGGPYYSAAYSDFVGLTTGDTVYAQVDSAYEGRVYGGVQELHEILGQPYNNVFGPVILSAQVERTPGPQSQGLRWAVLPPR